MLCYVTHLDDIAARITPYFRQEHHGSAITGSISLIRIFTPFQLQPLTYAVFVLSFHSEYALDKVFCSVALFL